MAKKLNRDEKLAWQAADVARFLQEYGRKRQKRGEPNDRRYDRKLEATIKKLPPGELDSLMRQGQDGGG